MQDAESITLRWHIGNERNEGMSSNEKPAPAFYWVETNDHDEDWLVAARTSRSASGFYEDCEGYFRTRFCNISAPHCCAAASWSSHASTAQTAVVTLYRAP